MGFFITEEKELPEFNNNDAGKVLKVDSSGVYLEWLQETTSAAELPSQTGNANRLLTTNGSTPSWTDAPTVSSLTTSGNINFSANDLQLRRSGNLFMRMSDSELGGTNRKIEFCAGGAIRRLLVTAASVDVESSVFSVLKTDAIHSIAGILNLPTAGSASAPSLMFGDNILTPVANRSGIWGSDDNVFFGTQGVQRVNINNTGMIISGTLDLGGNGTNANPSLMFGDNTAPKSGIYGTNGVINFTTEGTERMRIGQNFNDHFQTVTTNQRFQAPGGDTGGYRFDNAGDNRIVCNSNVVSLRANGANTLSVSSTTATVDGALSVTGTGTISGNLTANKQLAQPFHVITTTGDNQIIDLEATFGHHILFNTGSHTPATLRFISTNFTNGMSFTIVPNSTLSGAVLKFRNASDTSMRIFQGGVMNTYGPNSIHNVDVSNRTQYYCVYRDMTWWINSSWVTGNAIFPGTVSATGFSSSGSASITSNLTAGGYVDTNHVRIPAGQEIRFGTTTSLTNCVRGGTEDGEFFVSVTVNALRNVIFRPNLCSFDKSIEQLKCPIQEFDTYNTGGETTLGGGSPPIIFISRPSTHYATCRLILPVTNTDGIPEGWTIKIIHVDMGGSSQSTAEVRFNTSTVNLWSDGTQSVFNANVSNIIPIGSVWTIMNHKGLGKWYVTGWSKP